jgi:hypothetical protein
VYPLPGSDRLAVRTVHLPTGARCLTSDAASDPDALVLVPCPAPTADGIDGRHLASVRLELS